MNWLCPVCKKPQKASPHVDGLIHIHNGQIYHLKPFKKETKQRGVDTVKSLKQEVWDLFRNGSGGRRQMKTGIVNA